MWGSSGKGNGVLNRPVEELGLSLHPDPDSEALSGAANPGCSRLSAALCALRTPGFPSQETLPPGIGLTPLVTGVAG
jgi:hypothetical protein